jgi:hypothetical protein
MFIRDVFKEIRRATRTKANLFLLGKPGIGKTDGCQWLANEMGIGFKRIVLPQYDEVDLRGIPEVNEKKRTVFYPTEELPYADKDKENGILLLDELPSAKPSVQIICFKPNEILLGCNKPIKDVKEGEHVVGADGGIETVCKTFERDFDGKLVHIEADYLFPLECTPEHPIRVVRRDGKKHTWDAATKRNIPVFLSPEWTEAKNIRRGDFVVIPKIRGKFNTTKLFFNDYIVTLENKTPKQILDGIPLNEETAWFLGLYVAEGFGWNSVGIATGEHEAELHDKASDIILRYFGYGVTRGTSKKHHGLTLRFGGGIPARFLHDHCGNDAHTKKIPDFILYHENKDILRAFLRGYFAGDGHSARDGREVEMVTVSKLLALQLQLAFARFGAMAAIYVGKPKNNIYICGKLTHSSESYKLYGRTPELMSIFGKPYLKKRPTRYSFDIGDSLIVKVANAGLVPYKGKVYNVETTNHTYVVNSMAVHNCHQLLDARRLGALYFLPENWITVATGNRAEDYAFVYDMPPTVRTRCVVLNMEASFEDWKPWAIDNGVSHEILSFLNNNGQDFDDYHPEKSLTNQPLPRTWTLLSRYLIDIENHNDSPDLEYIIGQIGEGAGQKFHAWRKIYKEIPDISGILRGEIDTIPSTTDKKWCVVCALTSKLVGTPDKDVNFIKYAKNTLKYIGRLDSDIVIAFLNDVMHTKFWNNNKKMIMKTQEWMELSKKHAKTIVGDISDGGD